MNEYLDVLSWRESKGGKKFAVRLGSAKKLDNGNIAVYLDALPIPDANGCQLTIAPKRAAEAKPSTRDDSEIPF